MPLNKEGRAQRPGPERPNDLPNSAGDRQVPAAEEPAEPGTGEADQSQQSRRRGRRRFEEIAGTPALESPFLEPAIGPVRARRVAELRVEREVAAGGPPREEARLDVQEHVRTARPVRQAGVQL